MPWPPPGHLRLRLRPSSAAPKASLTVRTRRRGAGGTQREFQTRRLLRERISQDEVRSAVRQQGILGLEQVEAVILETNGDLSVVARDQVAATALKDVDLAAARTGRRADPSGVAAQATR